MKDVIYNHVLHFYILKSTFNIPNLYFVLKGVKGDTKGLGLTTDGSNLFNYAGIGNQGYLASYKLSNASQNEIGKSNGSLIALTSSIIGVSTNSSTSGIISEISNNISYVIKF